jgi:hypothetical protein
MCALLLVGAVACGRDSSTVASCRRGRERPHELFGRLKAEKVGSLPPVLVVSRTLLLGFRSKHLVLFQRSAEPQGEDLGTGRGAE